MTTPNVITTSQDASAKHSHLPWNDPSYWVKISIGECKSCKKHMVLRKGECFLCEQTKAEGMKL